MAGLGLGSMLGSEFLVRLGVRLLVSLFAGCERRFSWFT